MSSFEEKLSALRSYWDEEQLPVLGDKGARGWGEHLSDAPMEIEGSRGPSDSRDYSTTDYGAWAESELNADMELGFPVRTAMAVANESLEDPERVVLFDDVAPFLVQLEDPAQLVLRKMIFFGIQLLFRVLFPSPQDDVVTTAGQGWLDGYIHDEQAYASDFSQFGSFDVMPIRSSLFLFPLYPWDPPLPKDLVVNERAQ